MIARMAERSALTLTFNTTEDCNLACSYCYEVGKRPRTLDPRTARKFIDLMLGDEDPCGLAQLEGGPMGWLYEAVTLDFIGGDSLMHPRLLDGILSYWTGRVYTLDTPNARKWRRDWRASISSNGTLFASPEVRAFIDDWLPVLSVGVSVDGCPRIHDENRVFADGSPSMPVIMRWWDWYRQRFPQDSRMTKATCSRNSIPHLYESLKFMHEEMGIIWINQNFIFEDTGCTPDDYAELRRQMERCVEYVYEHRGDLYWSMIDRDKFAHARLSAGHDWERKGHCGSGSMPALGVDGRIYPCFRFLPHTQERESALVCGDVERGLWNKAAFKTVCEAAYRANCTTEERCRQCEYESACAYCIAGCHSEYGEFRRQTHICEITRIQVEYARKYWAKIDGGKDT